jgi:predicted  nucleic acid-binding Zn-ribbon protein
MQTGLPTATTQRRVRPLSETFVMTSAADLYALQEVDLRRDSRRALIADIETRLVETPELMAAREEAADALAQADQLRKDQRELEAQIQDLDAKVRAQEEKLYGGSIRNPKELSDLQHEVESLKAHRSTLDDQALEGLEVVEVAQATAREAEDDLNRLTAEWLAGQERLRNEKAQAEEEMARLDADRNNRTQGMDTSALGLYESLRKTKQGRAVARLDRGSCQGCRLTLPTNLAGRVRAAADLVQCPSCGRILVAS